MQFVECLLGAAASLETFSETAATCKCCMTASRLADGMLSRSQCDPVEIAGLEDTGETKVDARKAGSYGNHN